MYNSTQSLESLACHLELVILSRRLGITGHQQSSVPEYFVFFQQNSLEVLQDLHFHKVMGIISVSKTSTLLRFYNFSE